MSGAVRASSLPRPDRRRQCGWRLVIALATHRGQRSARRRRARGISVVGAHPCGVFDGRSTISFSTARSTDRARRPKSRPRPALIRRRTGCHGEGRDARGNPTGQPWVFIASLLQNSAGRCSRPCGRPLASCVSLHGPKAAVTGRVPPLFLSLRFAGSSDDSRLQRGSGPG